MPPRVIGRVVSAERARCGGHAAVARKRAADAGSARNIIDRPRPLSASAIRALNLPGPMNAWDLQNRSRHGCRRGHPRRALRHHPGVPATGEAVGASRVSRTSTPRKLGADTAAAWLLHLRADG